MSAWQTLAASGETELVVLNSRFIASGAEVRDVAQAERFLKEIQARYADAGHHCYAFKVLGPPIVDRFSDDGEPNGTAGRPILTVLEHHLANAIIVVTRYFGGTKLGTGGLVKAYTQAAKALIETVGTVTREPEIALELEYPYPLAPILAHWLDQQGFRAELVYGERVAASLRVPSRRVTDIEQAFSDWSHQGLEWLFLEDEAP